MKTRWLGENREWLGVFRVLLLAWLWVSAAVAEVPEVTNRTLDDGTVEFQIRGLKTPPARLVIEDIRTAKRVATVKKIAPAQSVEGFTAAWKPGRVEGVYVARLYDRNGVEIDMPREMPSGAADDVKVLNVEISGRDEHVSWSTDRAALVRVNAGLDGGMFIKMVSPWRFAASGAHRTPWDFWDDDRVAHYKDSRALQVYALAVPLPSFLIVVGQPDFATYRDLPLFRGFGSLADGYTFDVEVMGASTVHDAAFPGRTIPVVVPGDRLRLRLDEPTRRALARERFEYLFYLNGEFFYEESDASDPTTVVWPGEGLGAGLQLLTVNIFSFSNGYGSRTIPILVQSRGTGGQL